MSDVLTITDLETAKKHDTFHNEVITGKVGGLSTGADINYATSQVTGQMQKTLPKVLRDLGMMVQTWTATTGGTLTDASQVFLNDITASAGEGNYYAWTGAFPKVVAPGTDPAAIAGFVMRSDAGLRGELLAGALRMRDGLFALRDIVSVKDFGAVGDGVANDTAAIQKAIGAAIAANKTLYIPSGVYIAHGLIYSTTSSHCSIIGDGSGTTILKNNVNADPVLTVTGNPNQFFVSGVNFSGNGSVTSWGTGVGVSGNALVGTLPTTRAAVTLVDLVHATFVDCYFTNSIWGADIRGGIGITFISCYAYWNSEVGYRVYQASWMPTSGWPNVITFRDCSAKENGQVGLYFDDGRMLIVDGGDYEGNGKNTVHAPSISCGIYIGSNTGKENGQNAGPNGGAFHSIAASISNVWFEQNGNNSGSGIPNGTSMAHIVHRHGFLVVDKCNFTNTTAGRAIRVDGGQYKVENCSFESALAVAANQIDEGGAGNANLLGNNFINGCFGNTKNTTSKLTAANCTTDPAKTFFDYTTEKVLTGSGATSGGVLAVSWPAGTWRTAPIVQAQVFTNDGGATTYSAEVFGVTTTGASIRAKQNSGGTVTQPPLTVSWIAVGV